MLATMVITTPTTRVVITVISLLITAMLILEIVVITIPTIRAVITVISLLTMVILTMETVIIILLTTRVGIITDDLVLYMKYHHLNLNNLSWISHHYKIY